MRDEQGNNLYSIGKLADIVGIRQQPSAFMMNRVF